MLMCGVYREQIKTTWSSFRQEYESKVLPGLAPRSQEEVKLVLNHFERIIKPERVYSLSTASIDLYIATRRTEQRKKKGGLLSSVTINSNLRHLKSVLPVAVDWGYLQALPKFRFEREPKKLPRYVTGDHFAAIYSTCDQAKKPRGHSERGGADWWRALLATAYLIGWRIGDLLNLRRENVDLTAGTALIRWDAEGNKGKRDKLVKLHPVIVEHLRQLAGFDPHFFPWNYRRLTLQRHFAHIQRAAGIKLPCRGEHEHGVLFRVRVP